MVWTERHEYPVMSRIEKYVLVIFAGTQPFRRHSGGVGFENWSLAQCPRRHLLADEHVVVAAPLSARVRRQREPTKEMTRERGLGAREKAHGEG